jgi:hypothetical protein
MKTDDIVLIGVGLAALFVLVLGYATYYGTLGVRQLRVYGDEDQLLLGKNTAVISSSVLDGVTRYVLPNPLKADCNFILSESANGESQVIHSGLKLDGDLIHLPQDTFSIINTKGDIKIEADGGSIELAGNPVIVDGNLTNGGDLVFTNTSDHAIRFDAAATTGAGKLLSILGNDGASGSKGGQITIQPGAATVSSSGGLLNLAGGAATAGATGGIVHIQAGFSSSGSGAGGEAQIFGGGSVSGAGGNVRLAGGIGATSRGNIQLGLQGFAIAPIANSVNVYLDAYFLNNNLGTGYQSPLNTYAVKTYAPFTFTNGVSATCSFYVVRIGKMVTVGWSRLVMGGGNVPITSSATLDTPFRPFEDTKIVCVSISAATSVTGMITVDTSGFVYFTSADGSGVPSPIVEPGGCSYFVP